MLILTKCRGQKITIHSKV